MLAEPQCKSHDKVITRIKGIEKRLDLVDRKSFVPSINFRWAIGVVVTLMMGLYGYNLKTLFDTQDKLVEIRLQQQVIIYRMETLQDSVFDLKWDVGGDYGPKRNSSRSKVRGSGSR